MVVVLGFGRSERGEIRALRGWGNSIDPTERGALFISRVSEKCGDKAARAGLWWAPSGLGGS